MHIRDWTRQQLELDRCIYTSFTPRRGVMQLPEYLYDEAEILLAWRPPNPILTQDAISGSLYFDFVGHAWVHVPWLFVGRCWTSVEPKRWAVVMGHLRDPERPALRLIQGGKL